MENLEFPQLNPKTNAMRGSFLDLSLSLEEVAQKLFRNLEKGSFCPCCGQYAKRYKRKMYATPCLILVAYYKLGNVDSDFHHINEALQLVPQAKRMKVTGDSHKANYFDLLEQMPKPEEITHKRTSGFWRITHKGKLFVERKIKIPRYALVYNAEILGFEGEEIGIEEALGKQFNYEELMSL